MTLPLREQLVARGAETAADGRVLHCGAPGREFTAALEHAALVDRSDLARLRGDGPDLLALLNRLSTAAVGALPVGAGRQTVLTTNKGRIAARLFVYRLADDDVLLIGGPGGDAAADEIRAHIDRYTIAERTGLRAAGDEDSLLAVFGPKADAAREAAGLPISVPRGAVATKLGAFDVVLLDGDGISPSGWSLLVRPDDAAAVWDRLAEALAEVGGSPTGELIGEASRILAGTPIGAHELTEQYNPLEAGLWDAVDFDKGCYVGQEVVARLRTYDKVSRELVRLEFEASEPPATPEHLLVDGTRAGTLCSAAAMPGGTTVIGLGYLKKRAISAIMRIEVGEGERAPTARRLDAPEA